MTHLIEVFSPATMLVIFGIAAGVLSIFAFLPYIFDTVVGRTQPQRASWFIWSVLGSIAFVAQVYEGATGSLWFAGIQASGTIVVFLLSIRRGHGKYLNKTDLTTLAAAGIGLVLWYFTESALYALIITISISLLGGLATVIKAYRHPQSETLITWVLSLIAATCAIVSVGEADFVLLAYPLYLFTLYIILVTAILSGRFRNYRQSVVDRRYVAAKTQAPAKLAVFRFGLRTFSHGVVVVAAAFLVAGWVAGNSKPAISQTATLLRTPVQLGMDETDPLQSVVSPVASVTRRSLAGPGGEVIVHSAISSTSVLAESTSSTGADLTESNAKTEPETRVIVIVVPADSGFLHSPAGSERVKQWLAGSEIPGLGVDTVVEFKSLPDTWHAQNVPHHDFVDSDEEYLRLDEDDPFGRMVVKNTSARLITANTMIRKVLPQGAKVVALATSGEWFRVRTSDGLKGYMHRSDLAAQALELVSDKLAS